jgi:hypothetical protein
MVAVMATRAEVCDQLARLVFAARREMPVTRKFTTDAKTPYDEAHEEIDAKLSLWEVVGRG